VVELELQGKLKIVC